MADEVKVRVSQNEIYTLGEFRLREKLYRQGIKFDINTISYDDPKTDDIIYIQKVPSLGVDFSRYEKYLQWFMDKFIVNKKELNIEGEDFIYPHKTKIKNWWANSTTSIKKEDPQITILDLQKLYSDIKNKKI